MAEAKACAATDTEKARVRLFEQGQWDPMVKAKRLYDSKSKYAAEVAALQTAPPPASRIPRLAVPASGDLAKVDWTQGETLRLSRDIFGYPAPERQVEATILHDGQYLYLRLQEKTDATKLQAAPDIFTGDDWELFWAAQRERPYRQIGINPRGAFQAIPYGEPKAWDHALAVASEATPDAWTTRLCLPLANVIPDGLKPGQTLYFNVVRASTAAQTPLAYSPHFILNFHVPARLAALKVE